MCGIAAIFVYNPGAGVVEEGELISIREAMASRGPDGAGIWFDPARRIGLAHRRLSIIDISSAGHQPMLLPERNLAITFNGEIYNHLALRGDLEKKGHRFRSTSDTEVLLHLYAEEGEAMVEKLRGMYAFAIWDGEKQSLFLARDPFGIKPLYIAENGGTFRAASQVKALLAGGKVDTSPEPAGHVGYFLWGHVPAPYTLYRGIRTFPAGHCMTLAADGKKQFRSFCDITKMLEAAESREHGLAPPPGLLASSLRDSVRHHLMADVPVGVFLSAGLDSSTLAALASELGGELRTVTLGFEQYKGTINDETRLAEEVARHYGTRHQTIWVTRKDFENDLHHLLHSMDQPSSDGVNSYFISKAAAQAGLKVALSGLGGDELFAGYPGFQEIPKIVSVLRAFRHVGAVGRGFRAISAPVLKRMTSPKFAGLLEYGSTYGSAYLLRRGMFMPWELPGILDPEMVREGWNELQTLVRLDNTAKNLRSPRLKISALEMSWYMRHQLLRDTDWASMAHSLEVRVPLVDLQLLEATAPLLAASRPPTKGDMARTPSKPLPASVLGRRKTGFTVPVRDWLLQAFDPSPGTDRGLRGWTREIYSIFADSLENHRDSLRRSRKITRSATAPSPMVSTGQTLRVFVLLTDGFGGFGGISKFNRDLLSALCSHPRVEEVVAVPRLVPHTTGPLPEKLVYVTSGLRGKMDYVRAALQAAKDFKSRNQSGAQCLIVCAHLHLLPAAMAVRRIVAGPLHLIVHGVDAWKPTHNSLTNFCVRRVDGFISVSNVTKRRFIRWSGLRDDQGVVLPNCVDLSAFGPGPKSDVLLDRYQLRGRKVLLTLGRLASEERYKGFDEVLQILPYLAKRIPGISYLICGDGLDRQRLVEKAKSLDLDVWEVGNPSGEMPPENNSNPGSPESGLVRPRVVFAGRIFDAEKADHYRLADLYIMPSSGEGFGIVYLEALACGVPVIGSKADGSREALLYGRLGALVDPRDAQEIVAAVLKVLKPAVPPKEPAAVVNGRNNGNHSGLDHFSSIRFERRVHEILDCIGG